ncbi:MAG: ATP-binding protein, partial [Cyclobacteriaceae bacterium]|nr:ATP-binding protein [Cyclobacteriaceae bacterium]
PYSLSLNNTISLFKDRQGIVWVGTFGGGINLYDPTKYKFNKVVANLHQPEALSNDFTLCFLEDSDGDIWIGTDGGGLNMVTQDNKHIHFQHDGNEGNNRNAISGNVITSLAEDINEKIWITTFGAGISIYDKKNKKFTRHNTNSNHGLQHNTAWTIIRDREDYMWIGFETGAIAKYNANTDHYEYVKKDSTRETISFIRYLFEDHAGNLWCAMMNNGLWLVDKEKMTMKQVDLQELNYFSISHIMEDSQHRIWMGSERFGLINLIPDNNGQATFEVMPLSNDSTNIISVRGIVEDNQGELWLSSDKGVFQFNPDTRQSHQFTLADGLQSNQFSFSASMKTKNGLIYLGGPKGYNFFNPENIEIKQTAQNVMITNLFLFDQAVSITSGGILRKNILETQEIVLDYTQSTLGFEFSELNFSRNKEKRYCYMLEGMDDSWLTNRPESNVRYTNLSPGEYTFLVRPTANGACLSEKGVTLSIIILPPWWETWWFKLAAILITGLLVVLLFQFRLKMIKESNRKLERIVNERTEELLTINNQLSENNEKLLLAQNQLYASEKMASLGNLMAGIAHEINNPMNFIKGGMEALDENRMELAEYLNQVEKAGLKDNDITYNPLQNLELIKRVSININNGIKRILFIIDGLRVFTRSGKDQTEKVNIHQNIDATLIILEHSYRHVASVNTDYGKLPYIHCNPGKLNQAFSNLISNSIHAIEEKVEIDPGYRGVILIRTSYNEENEQVHLSFYDNGPGVPDQVMKNLYEPFVTTKAQGKGTGLGLSLTYSIIAEHQGEIKYSREMISNNGKEEEFTLFDISLPIG